MQCERNLRIAFGKDEEAEYKIKRSDSYIYGMSKIS